jgi:quercetin dioxygenase-like cupin family protein
MASAAFAIAGTLLVGSLLVIAGGSAKTLIVQATPEAPAAVVIASEVLGSASPVETSDPELALGRVTIMPGAVIPVHHHPGTQIGAIVQGTLTYTVFTGTVDWVRADQPGEVHYTIGAGETVRVPAGDALIEAPGSIHQGRNDDTVPVVIYLSTLFPAGAPRAIIDATPAV